MSRIITDTDLLDNLSARILNGKAQEFAASDKAYVARFGRIVFSITYPELQRHGEEFGSVAAAKQAFIELSGNIV